jgi:hypothetical protein
MGSKEIRHMYIRTCIDRSVIVALSAWPPGANELCVCVCVCVYVCVFKTSIGHPGMKLQRRKSQKTLLLILSSI